MSILSSQVISKILSIAISMAYLNMGYLGGNLHADETLLKISSEQIIPPQTVTFTPPPGWRFADADKLPPSVKLMVVGESQHSFPPSINIGTEPFNGTLKEYLKVIKSINQSKGVDWKDLGMIRTEAGNASLSQLDTKTEWGSVRMMHVILVKDKIVSILTVAALKEEFPQFYNDFFSSMRSLRWSEKATD